MIELWSDVSPGERRAAVVDSGTIVEVHLQRDLAPVLGQAGVARIDRKTPSGAYIIDDDGTAYLVRRNAAEPEGARVAFEITREPICEPGRTKPAEARLIDINSVEQLSKDELWAARLDRLGSGKRGTADIAQAFDAAIAGVSHIDDVSVSFQRTKAGLIFDIDAIGDPLASNIIASSEIARLLRLYQVGGMAMIDFIAVESKEARQLIADAFDGAAQSDGRPYERSAVNGFGVMQVVRAKPRPSVLDLLFGTRIASLSDETQALWLLRDAARSTGFGPRAIRAANSVATLLQSDRWATLRTRCERQMGAALTIVADPLVAGYGHVHVAQS